MLRIYATAIDVVRQLAAVIRCVERRDRDLARQMRRAAASIVLNIGEGSGSGGGTRTERYRNALGSARETGACLDVAAALGYIGTLDDDLLDGLDRVRATLVKVIR
jgi:four helix bundle protein